MAHSNLRSWLPRIALWLLADERSAQIVVGPRRPEHLAPIAEALEHPLEPNEREQLQEMFG